MKNDIYYNPTKIYFGKEAECNVGEAVAAMGVNRVLIHYGSERIKENGLFQKVANSLREEGLQLVELGGVSPNPKASLVYEGINLCRKAQVEFIVAIGGGSVIDSAKAIAAGSLYDGDFWDFYIGIAAPEKALPVAAVLTIPAAGSESSNSSVITHTERGYKRYLDSDTIRPVFSTLNPELTYTLTSFQTACGIVDAFAHVCERYFTLEEDVRCTDYLCEGIMKALVYYGRRVQKEPNCYNVRAEIMWACKIAHDGSIGVGRLEDWASHMIEHEISAENDTIHGAGLAVIMPAWMKYVFRRHPEKFAQMAINVFGIVDQGKEEDIALKGIRAYECFLNDLGMPRTMGEINIGRESYAGIADRCVEFSGSVGNYMKIYKEDVMNILKIAETKEE